MSIVEDGLIFIGILVTSAILMKWWNKKEKSTKYRYPPSLPSLPLVGSLPFIRNFNDVSVFFAKKAKELGPIFTFRIGNRLILTLNNKDVIEKAAVRNSSVFSNRPKLFCEKLINPQLKGLVFMTEAKEWKKHQHLSLLILKEFGFGMNSTMETMITREAEAIIEFIQKKKGGSFDPAELFFLVTSNITYNFLFGRRREFELGPSELCIQIHRYAANLSFGFDVAPFIRFLPTFRQMLKSIQDASQRLFEIVETETAKSLQNSSEPCFVKEYIQKVGPDYDREQLNFLLRDFGVAGTDTTAFAIQWSLVALANNPHVQTRLQEEIDAILPGDRLPTLQDKGHLPYVEATILEILRWRTLAPLALPRSTSQDSIVDGYFIPRGTMVFLNLYAAHNDTDIWQDPEVFRPERFLDKENNVIGKDRMITFSLGRRSCVGEALARAEIFLIVTSLVKRFHILPPEGQDKVSEDKKLPVPSILAPLPFKIRFVARR